MAGKGFAPQPAPKQPSKASQVPAQSDAEIFAEMIEAIGEDHYALTLEEMRAISQVLTPSERVLLLHFKVLNPRGEGSQTFELQALAKDWKMDRNTVYQALKRLHELKYLNIEVLEEEVVVSIPE
ncbi:hypothetical protein [Pantanalinema sp. GBBB05]|uniref:hypothetical protein n=1 Tax=Pantanalinema sp. GBBB05 TaxID=2604139 RepID=UPI001D657798|nr:hypothetical protein [Pantanalinema sp. GBBB05]